MYQVLKRDGKVVDFDLKKINDAIKMAFEAQEVTDDDGNVVYYDINVSNQVDFDSDWAIDHIDFTTDKLANEMHEQVVSELIEKIKED